MAGKDAVRALLDVAERVVGEARRAGADAAEVLLRDGAELTAKVRLGEPELVQEAGSRGLGLRVFRDGRSASVSSSDLRPDALSRLVLEACELATLAEPDPDHGLPAPDELAQPPLPELDLWDEAVLRLDAATALEWARRGEAAARAADPRVTNSEGATVSRTSGAVAFATSGGFSGGYRATSASLFVEPICDDEGGKKRNGYWWTAARHLSALEEPEAVGREAARRTVSKLGARKIPTREAPIVFDPEAGRAIVRLVFSVANGSAFYRRSSYLLGREGSPIASPLVTIVDDPLLPRGPGSRPFDGDGLGSRRNVLVDAGALRTVLCDVYSARKLGRPSTGSSGRGLGGEPGPTTTNLVMSAGATPAAKVVRDVAEGLYVTEMMGFGFNPVTGDFSRGASGFWIERGELAHPVSEITISANLDDLLQRIDAVGDDLALRASTACPTFRVSRMTIAGL